MSWRYEVFSLLANPGASDMDREHALALKRENLPTRQFRYQPHNDRSLVALRRSQAWLSPPRKFNDPFDSAVTFSMMVVFEEIQSAPKTGHRSELYKIIQGDESRIPVFVRD